MCGVFGTVRSGGETEEARTRTTEILMMLGAHSEERGKDASGLALVGTNKVNSHTLPTKEMLGSQVAAVDNAVIVKDVKPFTQLDLEHLIPYINNAQTVIGHTRWATQGDATALVNASPLAVGALIGTHNGDVTPSSVPHRKILKHLTLGETDTELLYQALSLVKDDRREMTKILRAVNGRAALAFIDRTRSHRLYLARTALSPLSYAYSDDGDFFYASNPNWFRKIQEETEGRISFTEITLIPEGHLLTINTLTGDIEDIRRFTATIRENDVLLINTAVYRNFTPEDKAADKALSRHKIVSAPLKKEWPTLTYAPTKVTKAVTTTKKATGTTPAKETPMAFDGTVPAKGSSFKKEVDAIEREFSFDIEELEALCWAYGDFDYETYDNITMASSEEEADELFFALLKKTEEDYKNKQTAPGFSIKNGMPKV